MAIIEIFPEVSDSQQISSLSDKIMGLKQWNLTRRQLCDLELILNGFI